MILSVTKKSSLQQIISSFSNLKPGFGPCQEKKQSARSCKREYEFSFLWSHGMNNKLIGMDCRGKNSYIARAVA